MREPEGGGGRVGDREMEERGRRGGVWEREGGENGEREGWEGRVGRDKEGEGVAERRRAG